MSSYSSPAIDLSASQKRILQELVTRHRETEDPVKGETIAEGIDRNAGTIRNQMQSLKALQLVEGIPGPHGGYKPTATAYDALTLQDVSEPADVPLSHEGEPVEGAIIEEIDLTSVLHPENCRAEVTFRGVVPEFQENDPVVVGPTPCNDLRIEGTVEGVDDLNKTVVLVIESMQAPAR